MLFVCAARAGEKLRRHGVYAVHGHVFMHTNPHNGDPWNHTARAIDFLEATDDTAAATRAGARAWHEGFHYIKVGIVLAELIPVDMVQPSLLAALDRKKRQKLNAALDAVNARWGRQTIYPAAAGITERRRQSTSLSENPRATLPSGRNCPWCGRNELLRAEKRERRAFYGSAWDVKARNKRMAWMLCAGSIARISTDCLKYR
jgi:hypothetical protein